MGLMTPAEFAAAMREIDKEEDTHRRHEKADELLCRMLKDTCCCREGVEIFEKMSKWYS